MVFLSIIFYANQVKNYSQSKNNLQKFYWDWIYSQLFLSFIPKKYLALYCLSFFPWDLWVSFSPTVCQVGHTVSRNRVTERCRLCMLSWASTVPLRSGPLLSGRSGLQMIWDLTSFEPVSLNGCSSQVSADPRSPLLQVLPRSRPRTVAVTDTPSPTHNTPVPWKQVSGSGLALVVVLHERGLRSTETRGRDPCFLSSVIHSAKWCRADRSSLLSQFPW